MDERELEVLENEEELDDCITPEDLLGYMSVKEEENRIVIYDNYEIPEDVVKGVSKECVQDTIDIIYMLHNLKEVGIDYTNALSLCNNFVTNRHNREMCKIQGVQTQQQSI